MKDILPGAELIEVTLGINQGNIPLAKSKYFCALVFKQRNSEDIEVVRDIYSIPQEQLLLSFPPITNIGKRIKQCTKTILDKGFFVKYEFEDGSYLNTWS